MLIQDGRDDRHILIVQPLFGELNRCRRLLRDTMRALARHGIGSTLPDLPGTGESRRELGEITWDEWLGALAVSAASRPAHIASFRGGALLDGAVPACSHWRLTPMDGAAVLRDLERTQAIGDAERGADVAPAGGDGLAGYRMSGGFMASLRCAVPAAASPLRTVRLEGDAAPADAVLPGPPLWRRAEPGSAPELAEAIAADIAAWIEQCGG